MPVTLIATAGAANANSYATVAEAQAYLSAGRLNAPEFAAAASDDIRATALIWATEFLDQMVDWFGYKATRDQALRWPRSGVYDLDGFYVDKGIIPVAIQNITIQTANEFIKTPRFAEPALLGQGFSDVTVGPIHVKVAGAGGGGANPDPRLSFFPPYLATLISRWGILINNNSGMTQAKLMRV